MSVIEGADALLLVLLVAFFSIMVLAGYLTNRDKLKALEKRVTKLEES